MNFRQNAFLINPGNKYILFRQNDFFNKLKAGKIRRKEAKMK